MRNLSTGVCLHVLDILSQPRSGFAGKRIQTGRGIFLLCRKGLSCPHPSRGPMLCTSFMRAVQLGDASEGEVTSMQLLHQHWNAGLRDVYSSSYLEEKSSVQRQVALS